MMEFNEKLNGYIKKINTYLNNSFVGKKDSVYEAMEYSLLSGGKRVRPVLTLACAEALLGDLDLACHLGCAVEMIHAYSLIHDDLPCMDNDTLRRGKPTNHIVFGEAKAVLAGDALLNFACEYLCNLKYNPEIILSAIKTLYEASGADGMIGGQILDMEYENTIPDAKDLEALHNKKTGALINAACSLGAIASNQDKNIFREFSSSLGLAFQICDDILDVSGDESKIGKPVNSDEKNHKITFATLYGLDGAKSLLYDETQKAISSLDFLGAKGDFLKKYAEHLLNRDK